MAAPSTQATVPPAGTTPPDSSVSRSAWRMIICTGPEWRNVSASAAVISDRSVRTASICSGFSSRRHTIEASALSVVSPPALTSRLVKARTSQSSMVMPSELPSSIFDSKSSPGFSRRSAMMGVR